MCLDFLQWFGFYECMHRKTLDQNLSIDEIQQYQSQGFVIIRNTVPKTSLQKCNKSIEKQLKTQNLQDYNSWNDINSTLDSGFFDDHSFIGSEKLFFRANKPSQLVASTTSDDEFISLLYETGLLERAYFALDPNCTSEDVERIVKTHAIRLAQVALRYPGVGEGGRHIDGIERGISSPFDCLIGIALSDQTQHNAGNLTVWPGSHTDILNQLTLAALKPVPESPDETSIQRAKIRQIVHDVAKGSGKEVLLRAGDAIIANQKLVHCGGANVTDRLRSMVYFRIKGPHSIPGL